jgi:ribonuclease PH
VKGRTAEIQRLIGRSLRAGFDLSRLGARTLHIDCDVINADGGTRCASITGSYVAAVLALEKIAKKDLVALICPPPVAAVSVGIHQGQVVTDLCYIEDSGADVDLNFVACPKGIIEIQGTAEGEPFEREQLTAMIDASLSGCERLFEIQRKILSDAGINL